MKNIIYFIIALLSIGNCMEVTAGWYESLRCESATKAVIKTVQKAGLGTLKEVGNTLKYAAGATFFVYAAYRGFVALDKYAERQYLEMLEKKLKAAIAQRESDELKAESYRLNAESEFERCYLNNINAPRTKYGVPLPCQDEACKLALCTDGDLVERKISELDKIEQAKHQLNNSKKK